MLPYNIEYMSKGVHNIEEWKDGEEEETVIERQRSLDDPIEQPSHEGSRRAALSLENKVRRAINDDLEYNPLDYHQAR